MAEVSSPTIVQNIENEYKQAVLVNAPNREREKKSWEMYGGIEEGQYEDEDKASARATARQLMTINFIRQKVNANSGALSRNLFDADFINVENEDTDSTAQIKKMYLSDKEMMDWDSAYNQMVFDGNINRGVLKTYIDKRFHPLGNIAYKRMLPGTVTFDPKWKTISTRDCSFCFESIFMTASELIEMFPKAKEAMMIQTDLQHKEQNGEQLSDTDMSVTPNFTEIANNAGRNKQYEIVRKYEMVNEKVTIEFDTKSGKDLPVGGDFAAKLAFLNKERPDWEVCDIEYRTENRRVCMVTTVCSQIDQNTPLERVPCEMQIGQVPFFEWSLSKINGVCIAIPEILKDVQVNINYRETLITNLIENEAHGSKVGDPMMFGEDVEKMKDFEQNFNDPNRFWWTTPGAMAQNLLPQPIKKSQFPQDVRDQLLRLIDYVDRISGVPAVYDARSERSGESGYLFAQKTRAAEQQNFMPTAALKQLLNEMAEAWMTQAKIQYTIAGLPRLFKLNGGKECFKINVKDPQTGRMLLDFTNLPRHKVIIAESPASTTTRMIARVTANETLRVIPPDMIGTRTVLSAILTGAMDGFSGKDKEELDEFRQLEMQQARAMLQNKILMMEVQNKQLAQQLAAPVAPPAPQGMPGMPMEGATPAAPESMGTDGLPVPPAKSLGYSGAGMA